MMVLFLFCLAWAVGGGEEDEIEGRVLEEIFPSTVNI